MPTSELDKARAEVAISELENSIKKGQLSAQQVKMLEEAQTSGNLGYDPGSTSPEAVNMVTLYHNQTGAPHPTPEYMIRNFLTRRFPNETWVPQELRGKSVYTLEPNGKYQVPAIPCWLATDSPKRAELESFGIFGGCEKGSGFNNEFEVEAHMKSVHRASYSAYETAKARADQREMMELQRALLAAQTAQAAPVKEK